METDQMETDEASLENKNKEKLVGYPVDHGWAWMVMLGSFGMHTFNVGGLKSFGVLFKEFQKKFSASSSQLAAVYSLSTFMMFALGPLANALANRFSYRIVVMAGGLIIATGFILSSVVHSIWLLFISYGIIAGIGFGLSYSPFIVMVGHHFDKRRSLANGISVSGSGFGSFIFPNVIRLMLNVYNIDGVMLIFAGIMTHICICGSLIRPIDYYRKSRKFFAEKMAAPETMAGLIDENVGTDQNNENTESHLTELKVSKQSPQRNTITNSDSINSRSHEDIVVITDKLSKENQSLKSEDIVVITDKLSKENQSLKSDKTLRVRIKKLFSCIKRTDKNENKSMACLDCSLLLDPVFLVYGFALLFTSFGYMNIFIIIPSHAEDLGMTQSDAAFLVSLIGISDIIGRLFFGWFADLKLFSRHYQFFLCLFLCAFFIGIIPLNQSYSGLATLCFFTGLFAGAYIALVPAVLVDVLGLEKLSSSLGLSLLFVSIGMLLGPPIVGWIRDASHRHWSNSLYFCASLNLLGSSMVFLEPLAKRYKNKKTGIQKTESNKIVQ